MGLVACLAIAAGSVALGDQASARQVADVVVTNPTIIEVRKADDVDKPGEVRGSLGWASFWQRPQQTGPSKDRLDFTFDASADVLGILISVDVPQGFHLVEFAAGINAENYNVGARDWLFHVSDAGGEPDEIDEHIWFPESVALEAGDRVSLTAWLFNWQGDHGYVSPEVIVYYRWR